MVPALAFFALAERGIVGGLTGALKGRCRHLWCKERNGGAARGPFWLNFPGDLAGTSEVDPHIERPPRPLGDSGSLSLARLSGR